MSDSCEQKSRDMLARMASSTNWNDPQRMSASDVAELANLMAEIERLQGELREVANRLYHGKCSDSRSLYDVMQPWLAEGGEA